MWIAFRIVFLLGIRSRPYYLRNSSSVVNCFQNCIFTWHSQYVFVEQKHLLGCELLSELYFYLAFAVGLTAGYNHAVVVNCFQNCIFTWHSQCCKRIAFCICSCELLSELYFYLAFAVSERNGLTTYKLWIAFRIVFLLGIRSFIQAFPRALTVVNCFQNCIFTWHSQFAKATH